MTFLLDTNVLSELRKPRPHPGVVDWFADVRSEDLYLSVLVVGEIRQGIERLRGRDERRAGQIADWLGQLHRSFADRILPIGADVADTWGRLNAPSPRPAVDGLIAATALVHGLTIVTRNEADFAGCGAPVLNPFH